MEDGHQELQLLPTPPHTRSVPYSHTSPWRSDSMRYRSDNIQFPIETNPPLDLQLSISLSPIQEAENHCMLSESFGYKKEDKIEEGRVDGVKWQAADQVRIAAMEKAYAERVREMTKREMDLAQSEFSRARHMWERAREEIERVEQMKERATKRIDSGCMEITCQACRQKFRH